LKTEFLNKTGNCPIGFTKSEFVTSEEKIAKLKNYITNNGITNEIVKIVITG